MRKSVVLICGIFLATGLWAQELKTVELNPPDKDRGLPVMKALSLRASASEWDTTSLSLQDLSDLLWAAIGVNRPEEGKRTAPSALNAQDIDLYVFMKSGVYLYDSKEHLLEPVADGDFRKFVADRQQEVASTPVICVMVSDISRFRFGEEDQKLTWAAMDAGTVSQNIGLFCAGTGLATRPRANMDQQKLREILQLKESQHLMLNNPVSYRNPN